MEKVTKKMALAESWNEYQEEKIFDEYCERLRSGYYDVCDETLEWIENNFFLPVNPYYADLIFAAQTLLENFEGGDY